MSAGIGVACPYNLPIAEMGRGANKTQGELMLRRSFAAFALLLVTLLGAASARADVVFNDSAFKLANYASTVVFASDASASLAVSSAAGTLQFVSTASVPGSIMLAQGLANVTFLYDPATQGAIGSIDASVL